MICTPWIPPRLISAFPSFHGQPLDQGGRPSLCDTDEKEHAHFSYPGSYTSCIWKGGADWWNGCFCSWRSPGKLSRRSSSCDVSRWRTQRNVSIPHGRIPAFSPEHRLGLQKSLADWTFFKWIKQHLQIKTFLGTSKNAVLTQIWIAMISYLLLAWIKFQTTFKGSLHTLTVMFREVCLQPVQIINLLRLTMRTLNRVLPRAAPQLSLFWNLTGHYWHLITINVSTLSLNRVMGRKPHLLGGSHHYRIKYNRINILFQ